MFNWVHFNYLRLLSYFVRFETWKMKQIYGKLCSLNNVHAFSAIEYWPLGWNISWFVPFPFRKKIFILRKFISLHRIHQLLLNKEYIYNWFKWVSWTIIHKSVEQNLLYLLHRWSWKLKSIAHIIKIFNFKIKILFCILLIIPA